MEKVISFIIPSYNVENFLPKCLDSFLIADKDNLYKMEVIVVDDGSTDKTASIARYYVERWPEVFRVIHKENGGHGSTINVGSRAATGKYLKVVDADDWVVTENLATLLGSFASCEADVVLTPFHMVNAISGRREKRLAYIDDFTRIYTLDQIMSNWKKFDRCLTFHGIAYKRSFYLEFYHELPSKVFYEDQEYATIPCCYAKSIQVFNTFFYQYLIGNSTQSVAAHNQLKRIDHIEQVALRLADYFQLHSQLSVAGQAYLLQKLEGILLSYYTTACIINPDKAAGRKKCLQLNMKIRKKCPTLYDTAIKRKYRVFCLLSLFHINQTIYERLLHSRLYNMARRNHPREHE